MRIEGTCHCGHVSYEADIDPEQVYICHCTDCQQLTGTAFRWAVSVSASDFRLLGAKPKVYRKTAASGATSCQYFCPRCASPIYSTSSGDQFKNVNVRLGTARQRAELVPRLQYWHRSALGWVGHPLAIKTLVTE